MRYIVTFSDRTVKRCDEAAGKVFMEAMRGKEPIFYRGSMYAPHSIIAVKPIHVHESGLREEAEEAGLYRCHYGRSHVNRADCQCRDAGFRKILEVEEERMLLEEGTQVIRPTIAGQNEKFLRISDGN